MTPNIPLELQELIITEGREDYAFLLVCALVRQAWVPVSRSLLDIHVKLFSDRDFSHINRDIALPDTTLAQSIRSVHIDYRKTTKNYDRVLQEAFTKIPSIHTLTLDCAVLLSSNDESLDIVYNAFSRITALKLHDVRCDFSTLVIFLSRFQHLKYLAIDEVSFIYEDIGFQPLYSTLSPSLRELTLPTEFYEDEDGGYVKMLDWIGKSAPALRWLTVSFPPEFTTIMADMIQSLQANAVLEMQCVIFNAENLLEEYTSEPRFQDILGTTTSLVILWPSLSDLEVDLPEYILKTPRLQSIKVSGIEGPIAYEIQIWNNFFAILAGVPYLRKVEIQWENKLDDQYSSAVSRVGEALKQFGHGGSGIETLMS